MANYFNISPVNSFDWFIKDPVIDPSYNTIPGEFDRKTYNPNGLYYQKWQTNDAPTTQIFSDFVPSFDFYECKTNKFYRNIPFPVVANSIIGVSWKSYQCTVDFSTFALNKYYAQITYTDENANLVTWRTSPIDLAVQHGDTLKFEYTNTYNTQNLLFQTPNNLVLQFRVEGWIAYLDPESDTELYTDQEHNVTEEDSIPFFTETLYIGRAKGVPEWVIRKVNLIFTLDQKKIDGYYYEKVGSDSKFTPTRPEATKNQDAYWALPVIRNEDFFIDGYIVGDNAPENEIQVIVRSKEYLLNGGNIVLSNVLKKATRLSYVQITNRGLDNYNVLIGTTPGGSELGVYITSGNIVDTFAINKGFNTDSTLYLTGLTGHDTDVWIEWHQLDDKTSIPISGSGGFVKGTMYAYYELNPGDFENDFDIATGLGQVGSKYEGCALMGTNGLDNISGKILRAWNRTLPSSRQTSIGNVGNSITLTVAQLPPHHHEMVNSNSDAGAGKAATGDRPQEGGNLVTLDTGDGQPIDITPESYIIPFFVKIID